MPAWNQVEPRDFTQLLKKIRERPDAALIESVLLRSQSLAVYAPENVGHFGLALIAYAHFTSPIRRYADLLVHRSLVGSCRLGEGGLPPHEGEEFDGIGEAISTLERRAMEAERETVDRYVAAFLADRVGQLVDCRITGVQPFGFFATVEGLGGDGLVPVSTLGDEAFMLDERHQALVGQRTGESFALGDRLKVELVEADPVQGTLLFRLDSHEPGHGAKLARAAWHKGGGRKGAAIRSRRVTKPQRRRR